MPTRAATGVCGCFIDDLGASYSLTVCATATATAEAIISPGRRIVWTWLHVIRVMGEGAGELLMPAIWRAPQATA